MKKLILLPIVIFFIIPQGFAQIDEDVPIVVSTHIPFLTVVPQLESGPFYTNNPAIVINNAKEVLDLFKDHNLALVLQGRLHNLEVI